MQASLTQLRRDTKRVVRPALNGKKVTLTDHGKAVAQIVPLKPLDRKGLCDALRAIGPVELPPRN